MPHHHFTLSARILAGGAAALAALLASGCGVTGSGSTVTYDAYGRPTYATTSAYADSGYVYYPDSEVYYNGNRHDYVYRNGNRWIHQSTPPSTWNRSGLSVHLNFSDDPWNHHNEVIRQYPRTWHGRRDQHHDDRRNDHDRDHDRDHDYDRR